ncbi:lipopolysaccharide biosynthesis protein [Bosea caraganae]|uniref:lipopolysaccharide biosynthesis protein n=1 Tax=Bosea caraganae TaxID=2763117 RepID=UPI0015EFDFDF|nr:lipopolysaccharide biosynthesis protein [Bosea caraganae]
MTPALAVAGGASPAKSLSRRTIEGFAWMFVGAGSQALLRIAVLAVLARLLTPTDFGVVSAAMTVVALADIFGTIGIAPAIVQMPQLDREHVRTGFTVSALASFAITAILFVAAPVVAGLFQIPAVEPALRVLCFIFAIRGFAIVAEAKLQREMRFRSISLIGMASYALGYGAVAIGLALAGFGIWSLVWGQIAQSVLASLAFIACSRHAMRPLLHWGALRRLLRFGAGITLSSLGNYVALNADQFIVGRWLGAATLGIYNRAYTILMQPVNLFGAVGDKVLFPALATIQSDRDRLARAYCRSVGLIALATIPLSGFLTLFAEECIQLLLGKQWLQVTLPFQILVASLFFRTAYKISSTLLRARGMTFWLASWQWLYAASVCAGAWLGLPYGLSGVAAGIGAAIVITFVLGLVLSKRACALSLRQIAAIMGRHLLVAALINLPLLFLKPVLLSLGWHPILLLAAGGAVAGAIALVIFFAVPKLLGDEGAWLRSALGRKP